VDHADTIYAFTFIEPWLIWSRDFVLKLHDEKYHVSRKFNLLDHSKHLYSYASSYIWLQTTPESNFSNFKKSSNFSYFSIFEIWCQK
jgi:hypothetical protein